MRQRKIEKENAERDLEGKNGIEREKKDRKRERERKRERKR